MPLPCQVVGPYFTSGLHDFGLRRQNLQTLGSSSFLVRFERFKRWYDTNDYYNLFLYWFQTKFYNKTQESTRNKLPLSLDSLSRTHTSHTHTNEELHLALERQGYLYPCAFRVSGSLVWGSVVCFADTKQTCLLAFGDACVFCLHFFVLTRQASCGHPILH